MTAGECIDLFRQAWLLSGIEYPAGKRGERPPVYRLLRFRPLSHRTPGGGGVSNASAWLSPSTYATIFIDHDAMSFSGWVDNLVGSFPARPRPPQTETADPALIVEEFRYISSILSGTVHWSLDGGTALGFTKRGTGSLTFAVAPEA